MAPEKDETERAEDAPAAAPPGVPRDEPGRRLVQRHVDLVAWAVGRAGGRIVDTAGDGAFTCFPSSEAAANAMIEVLRRSARENAALEREHRLRLRGGIHFGAVLADE